MERIPVPALVVLVGASGSGKSTWAADTFGGLSVVSSDALRAIVGEDERDQAASAVAFDLLHRAVAHRLARRLTTVIDTTGLSIADRQAWRDAGRAAGLATVLVVFDVPASVCKARNRLRPRRVPDTIIDRQSRDLRDQRALLEDEGWDRTVVVDDRGVPSATVPHHLLEAAPAAARQADAPVGLRFGLHLSRFGFEGGAPATAERLARIAAEAEEAGFSSCWVMDHPVQIPQVGRAWEPILEPFTTLTHLAAHSTSLRLGTLVADVAIRPIPELGRSVAALDVLSGGRAVCGVGAGWYARDFTAFGRELPPLRDRFALLEDALRFLPVLWGPGTRPFEGHTLHVAEAICYPRPLQAAVPLLVGGQGERRTLRLAAEYADACNLFGSPEVVGAKTEVLRDHCRAVDRDPAEVQVTHLSTVLVGRDDGEVAAKVDRRAPARGRDRWRTQVHAGTVEDQIGRCRALADQGVEEVIVSLEDHDDPGAIETFAAVIEAF